MEFVICLQFLTLLAMNTECFRMDDYPKSQEVLLRSKIYREEGVKLLAGHFAFSRKSRLKICWVHMHLGNFMFDYRRSVVDKYFKHNFLENEALKKEILCTFFTYFYLYIDYIILIQYEVELREINRNFKCLFYRHLFIYTIN